MEIPDVRYARNGEVAIAYQVVGDVPTDIVFVRGFAGDLLSTWEQPLLLRHLLGVAEHGRVLMLDKRGQGLSDRMREVPTLETRMDDLLLVARLQGAEEPERILATVLFTDIVASSKRAGELGDHGWRELLERYHALVRADLSRCRGSEVDVAGDGFLATFDGPARAIRCACTIRDGVAQLGIEIRAGLHTGECEVVGEKVAGGRRAHRRSRCVARRTGGGARLPDGQGPRRRLGNRVRGPGRPRAEERSG